MNSLLRIALTLLLVALIWTVRGAGLSTSSVTLAWDSSTDTNLGPITYNIYWGVATRTYTNSASAGTNLTLTVTNLARGSTYYFAATALCTNSFPTNGTSTNLVESDYSTEVSWTAPFPPAIPTTFRIITAN